MIESKLYAQVPFFKLIFARKFNSSYWLLADNILITSLLFYIQMQDISSIIYLDLLSFFSSFVMQLGFDKLVAY